MPMKMNEILKTVKDLARSQGYYGRLYNGWMEIRDSEEYEEWVWDDLVAELESEEFENTLDLVLYLEEGKSKFEKVLDISKDGKLIETVKEIEAKDVVLRLLDTESKKVRKLYLALLNYTGVIDVLEDLGYEVEIRKVRKENHYDK